MTPEVAPGMVVDADADGAESRQQQVVRRLDAELTAVLEQTQLEVPGQDMNRTATLHDIIHANNMMVESMRAMFAGLPQQMVACQKVTSECAEAMREQKSEMITHNARLQAHEVVLKGVKADCDMLREEVRELRRQGTGQSSPRPASAATTAGGRSPERVRDPGPDRRSPPPPPQQEDPWAANDPWNRYGGAPPRGGYHAPPARAPQPPAQAGFRPNLVFIRGWAEYDEEDEKGLEKEEAAIQSQRIHDALLPHLQQKIISVVAPRVKNRQIQVRVREEYAGETCWEIRAFLMDEFGKGSLYIAGQKPYAVVQSSPERRERNARLAQAAKVARRVIGRRILPDWSGCALYVGEKGSERKLAQFWQARNAWRVEPRSAENLGMDADAQVALAAELNAGGQ